MQVSCLAVVILGFFAAMATSLQPPGSKTKGKSLSKPTASTDSMYNFKVMLKKLELKESVLFDTYVGDQNGVRVEMYNETMPVINGHLHLIKDLPPTLKIRVIGHRFSASNQWLLTFDQGWQNYCDFMRNNVSFMKNVLKATDMKECPMKKGLYTVTEMVIDEKGFPPGIPECKFRVNTVFEVEGKEIGYVSFYADIVHQDDYDD